jgi:hypothetical protein
MAIWSKRVIMVSPIVEEAGGTLHEMRAVAWGRYAAVRLSRGDKPHVDHVRLGRPALRASTSLIPRQTKRKRCSHYERDARITEASDEPR